MEENFDVIISDQKNNEPVVLTSKEKVTQWLAQALDSYDPKNSQYSTVLKDGVDSNSILTIEHLDRLAVSPQNNLKNIIEINQIVRNQINKNDLVGVTSTSIENNINTDYKLMYRDFSNSKAKLKTKEKAEELIDDFNEQINIKSLIRNAISGTFNEGNYCMYLRKKGDGYVVDYYPLGIAEISDYEINGYPVLLINIKELTNRLRKIMPKTKKGKALFFESIDEEIEANYPPEVYQAYKNKDEYAKLDIKFTGLTRTGNLNRKYGLTPFFRALYPISMLDTFANADRINTKAKAKKIIVQTLNDKLLGEKGDKEAFEEMAYAHKNLMAAWGMPTVVVTPPAYVKEIKYVEPQSEMTNIDTVNQYRNRVMTCLGIGFLSQEGKQTVSTANISIEQLMLSINKIAEQLEVVIHNWYENILVENGFDRIFAPKINIIDAEQMNFELKKSLAEFLYTTLGASRQTAYSVIGMDIEDEKQRRSRENSERYDEIFTPHATSYNSSGNSEGGRPPDENPDNPDKTNYDKNYNRV